MSLRSAGLVFAVLSCTGCESLVDFGGLSGEPVAGGCPKGALFCASFENGEKGAFDDQDGNPDGQNDLVEDPGPFGRSQNHAMRLVADADLVKAFPTKYKTLYARWYIKWIRNAAFRGGFYGGGQNSIGNDDERPTGDNWFAALVRGRLNADEVVLGMNYPGMYQACVGLGQCPPDLFPCTADEGENVCTKPEHRETQPVPGAEDEHWYCVAVMLDAGDPTPSEVGANGSASYAFDGNAFGPWNGLWMRTTSNIGVDALWLVANSAQAGPAFLLDDVTVSETPLTCD